MVRSNTIVMITILIAVPVSAQNLLVNPGFNVVDQLDGWTCTDYYGVASWSTEDRGLLVASGSMMHDVTATSNNRSVACSQCVPVSEGTDYSVSGWYYWPNDPDVNQIGSPRYSVFFYDDLGCTSFVAIGASSNAFPLYDMWLRFAASEMTAPAGALAAAVSFVTWQDLANDPVRARFDDLVFAPLIPIFSDDFETGGIGGWSSSTP